MNSNKAVNATSNMSKKASNMAKSSMEAYNSQSPAMKIVFTIVIILFIIFVIYIIYLAVVAAKGADANTPVIVNDVIDAYVSRPAFNLPTVTTGMTQTF
jgi:NADH:ubiquinone oxidoreductase subunit 3 (subunit A)